MDKNYNNVYNYYKKPKLFMQNAFYYINFFIFAHHINLINLLKTKYFKR